MSAEELDLFAMYTCQLLNFYQKELQKLEVSFHVSRSYRSLFFCSLRTFTDRWQIEAQ